MSPQTVLQKAQAAWDKELPEWIEQLASACDQTSQAQVATKIGRSTAYVSHVINRGDARSYDSVKTAFNLAFNSAPVECPVAGLIEAVACRSEQNRPFSSTNSQRVKQFIACRKCPRRSDQS